jgi:hypothetical protein
MKKIPLKRKKYKYLKKTKKDLFARTSLFLLKTENKGVFVVSKINKLPVRAVLQTLEGIFCVNLNKIKIY